MNSVQKEMQSTGSKRLTGKVAIVTGGSRGIGAAIALRLAEEGADVAITFNQNKTSADNIVARIAELGSKSIAVKADASSGEDAKKLVDGVISTFGKIDILINNAGVFEMAPVDQLDLDQYERVFDVNVKGVIATTIAALKKLSDGGRIINISSGVGSNRFTVPGMSVYSASKSALDTLTRIWAQDLGSRRITVNGVAPGATDTDMFNQVPAEGKDQIISKTALGRTGQPDDIAAVVAFLASNDAAWITGQTIAADGGINL